MPNAPEGPVEITNIKSTECTLSWFTPLDDGGDHIQSYVIDIKEKSKNNNSLISSQEAVKIIADSNIQRSSKDFVGNTMNIYLKKHKLDLTLLPNKKMIKLSDLTSNYSSNL